MHATINVCMQNFIHSVQEAKHYEMHTRSWIWMLQSHTRFIVSFSPRRSHKIDGN